MLAAPSATRGVAFCTITRSLQFLQKQLLEIEQTRRHPQAPRQTTLYMLAAPSATRGVAFAHNPALSPISHKKQ
jgi:hypothetical protein